jgi:AcrR family transcriptional regulator
MMSEYSLTRIIVIRTSGAKEKVERAAIELFAANGVDGVSIGDIATAAGVSQGALYRHYPSKEELAWSLFSEGYVRTGAEFDEIRARVDGLGPRLDAMVMHFCALYDNDPALFRFMLIAQHGLLPRIGEDQRTVIDVLADTVAAAVAAGEAPAVEPLAAAAVIIGIVLQTAVFHIYGSIDGPLIRRAAGLTRAALAAISALGNGEK